MMCYIDIKLCHIDAYFDMSGHVILTYFLLYSKIQCILTSPNPSVQAKNIFVRITEKFRYVKYIEKYITESSITYEYH